MLDHATNGPGQDLLLLPWHATARLSPSQGRRIDLLLRRDARMAQSFKAIRREQAATIDLNERLGAPSPRALLTLFAAIDAEPVAAKNSR